MLKILLVDDDVINNFICEQLIKAQNPSITVQCALNVADAIEQIQKAKSAFDIILLDITLPDGNGMDVLTHCQEHCPEKLFGTHTAVVSGSDDPERTTPYHEHPLVKHVYLKPVTQDHLTHILSAQR